MSIQKKFIYIEDSLFHNFTLRNVIKLLKLVFTIFVFSHLFACGWIFTGRQNDQQSWIIKNNLQNSEWSDVYVRAIYFALVTMNTIGYGDITAINNEEIIFCSIVMILACGMFGYSLNQIGRIFEILFRDSDCLRENIAIMNTYMKQKQISQSLQFQIRQYLQYYWNESKAIEKRQQNDLINALSRQLQQQLQVDANKLVLKDVNILSQNFSQDLLKQTVNIIKELNSTPDEIIFSEGEYSDQNGLYFIEQGKCELFLNKSSTNQPIKILNKGEYFGSYGFFTGSQRLCGVRSIGFCTLLYITRDDFLFLCKQHFLDYEKFCFIKDTLQFEGNFNILNEACYQCKQTDHTFKECPSTNFYKKQDYIKFMIKDSAHKQISRTPKQRNTLKFRKTLQNFNLINNEMSSYQRNKNKELQQYIDDNFVNALQDLFDSECSDEEDEGSSFQSSIYQYTESRKNRDNLSIFSKSEKGNKDEKNLSESTQQKEIYAELEPKTSTSTISQNQQTEQENNNYINPKKIVKQLSTSKYFKRLVQQQIDNQIKIITQDIDEPSFKFTESQTTNSIENKINLLNKSQKLKNKPSNRNKMVSKVKKIMNVTALFKKKEECQIQDNSQNQQLEFQKQQKASNQITLYLLKQKNLKEETSYTDQYIQNEFEHLYKFKLYYPKNNFDNVIQNYNIKNIEKNLQNEKNKPQNENKKKFLNKMELQIQFQRNITRSGSVINQSKNPDEILELFNQYREIQVQKRKSYFASPEIQLSPNVQLTQSIYNSYQQINKENFSDLSALRMSNYEITNRTQVKSMNNVTNLNYEQPDTDKIEKVQESKDDSIIKQDSNVQIQHLNNQTFSAYPVNICSYKDHSKYSMF
ncbi:cation channel family protein (macronuclear) [Tetrahymena thermophila SB210]|uniref:Cation channel family protein n=1 Tax=Tetrahymena thermophila (strain SB210) TaxID=312017 RepID=W7XI92_TETTS|nr:cation channel family protein [Tetrahymena thermophila SB210]EWS73104.1 cation channel family protein [Tetrahymena thermophila SB210]|eukprot:XP_012654353.1 cation channel family protein [Tetrahymena thermophila SB210]